MREEYKVALAIARAELEKLEEEREEMDNKIAQLKQTVTSLATLCKDSAFLREWAKEREAAGITQNCREVLKACSSALTPIELRDRLVETGVDPKKYTNLLASIHSILKRLVASREVRAIDTVDGSTAYRWRRIHRRRNPMHFPRIVGAPGAVATDDTQK